VDTSSASSVATKANDHSVQLQRSIRFAYVFVATLLAGWFLMQALPNVLGAMKGPPWDATDHYAAREFLQHHDPFTPDNVIARPPTSAFWFLPLARIPYDDIKPYITVVIVLLLFLQLLMIAFELELPVPLATATLAFCAILDTWWLQYHLGVAQTSLLISFTYTLAWLLLRRDDQIAAGVVIGFAATMKPFAGLLVLFLILTRRWQAVAAACVAWLCIAVYMTYGFGWHSWIGFLQSKRSFTDMWLGNRNNESLPTIVLHVFHPISRAGASKPLAAATAISTVLSLLLIAGAWLVGRKSARQASTVDLPYALFALLSVWCNPVVWEHYNAFLILPLCLAAVAIWRARLSGLAWQWAVPLALATFAIAKLFSMETRNALQRALDDPRLHARAQFLDVCQWIRWPLMMAVLAALIIWFNRVRPSAAEHLRLTGSGGRKP
jgi:hypothetical protein